MYMYMYALWLSYFVYMNLKLQVVSSQNWCTYTYAVT